MLLSISYNEARALLKSVSTEESRPVLNCVNCRPDVIETTNGHILFRTPTRLFTVDGDGDGFPVLEAYEGPTVDFPARMFPGTVLKRLRAKEVLTMCTEQGTLEIWSDPQRNGVPVERLSELNETAPESNPDGDQPGTLGRYPDTDKVWPRFTPDQLTRVELSGEYLKRIGEVAKLVGTTHNARLTIFIPSGKGEPSTRKPVEFEIHRGDLNHARFVMMPLMEIKA